jgi:pimeloyl-ACP methyl ester carboxylesterase
MSDLISVLIQNLNLTQRPDILGFSMGGMISLTLAARHPTVISNNVIIISGSYGGKDAPQPSASIGATLQKMVPVFLSRYDPAKQNHTEEYDDSLFELYFPKGAADLGLCGLSNHVVTLMWAQARRKISPQALIIPKSTLQAQATAIKTFFNQKSPTQAAMALKKRQFAFITGDSDAIIPAETSKKAVDASLPGSWHVKIPQAGHSLLYSHSSQIATIVLHYLDSNHATVASS